jgi:hypothetical protein
VPYVELPGGDYRIPLTGLLGSLSGGLPTPGGDQGTGRTQTLASADEDVQARVGVGRGEATGPSIHLSGYPSSYKWHGAARLLHVYSIQQGRIS